MGDVLKLVDVHQSESTKRKKNSLQNYQYIEKHSQLVFETLIQRYLQPHGAINENELTRANYKLELNAWFVVSYESGCSMFTIFTKCCNTCVVGTQTVNTNTHTYQSRTQLHLLSCTFGVSYKIYLRKLCTLYIHPSYLTILCLQNEKNWIKILAKKFTMENLLKK